MRICMLIYYYWPHIVGGAENQCRKLAATLVQQGHECMVLTCRCRRTYPAQETEASGVRIIRKASVETLLSQKGQAGGEHVQAGQDSKPSRKTFTLVLERLIQYGNIVGFSLAVLLFLARHRRSIDILHVHTTEWIAGLAAWAGRLFHLPVVCKLATLPAFPPQQVLCRRWRQRPHFIALTQAMEDSLLAHGIAPAKISQIPNGIHIPQEQSQPEQQEHFLYIANFSQSVQDKAFDILIEAWAAFQRLHPEARLIMLGGGDARPWQALAQQLGCAKSIDFAGYQTDLAPYFLQSCCLLLPSRKEGISNALLEAQSWGLPAIVSDIPGNREVVIHEHNGLIVPVGDAPALAQAMCRLYKSPKLRRNYGWAARKVMEERFSLDKVAEQTLALYRALIS